MSDLTAEMNMDSLSKLKSSARAVMETCGIDERDVRNGEHDNILETRKAAILAYAEAKSALFKCGINPKTIHNIDKATEGPEAVHGLVLALRVDLMRYVVK